MGHAIRRAELGCDKMRSLRFVGKAAAKRLRLHVDDTCFTES
jgi:hypothetical protein